MRPSEFDKRFYGIYRGVVVTSDDPQKKGRIKVRVPQITGEAVTSWLPAGPGGHRTGKSPYGTWISTSTQTASTTNNYVIQLDTTVENYDIALNTTTSQLVFPHAGTYNIQFSGQIFQPTNSTPEVDIWLQLNGVDVDNTAGRVTTSNQIHYVLPAWNYVITLKANDKINLMWRTSVSGTQLYYVPKSLSPAEPAVPSMIVTASLVDNWLPNTGDGVWVMYEGGDPNFPVWIGEI